MSLAVSLLALVALLATRGAHAEPPEVERLRAENAALAARVAALEAENAELRVLAGVTAPSGADEAPSAPVRGSYDEAAGETTIETTPTRLGITRGSRSRHWFLLRYKHPGQRPATPVEQVRVEIDTVGSGGVYRGATTLRLWVDGDAFECPVVGYRSATVTVGGGQRTAAVNEHVEADLAAAVLGRIGSARQVRGELGPTSFQLTPAQIVAARAFQRRLEG